MSAAEMARAAEGARAAAVAATGTLGRTPAQVRLPLPPLAAALEEELGLPSPEFRDIALPDCAMRVRSNGSRELLVAAHTLERALSVQDADGAKQTLRGAAFVQVGGESLLLRGVEALQVGGRAYLYRLHLREAAAEVRP